MPILAETAHTRKRRLPVWALILAVVVLLPVVVFWWSCYQPVSIHLPGRGIGFGYGLRAQEQAGRDMNANAQRRVGKFFPPGTTLRQALFQRSEDIEYFRIPHIPFFYYVWTWW